MPALASIRPATPADSLWAVPLITATIGKIGWALTGKTSDQATSTVLGPFFERGGNRLSHQQALVAELESHPVGLAVSYAGDQAAALDEPFRARLARIGLPDHIQTEAEPDEWYLDTLVTAPAFQGRGVGRALVWAVAAQARRAGWTRLGLLVDADALDAQHFYDRLGFREVGQRDLAGGHYLHLAHELDERG